MELFQRQTPYWNILDSRISLDLKIYTKDMEIIAYKQGLTEEWSVYPKNIPYVYFIILE